MLVLSQCFKSEKIKKSAGQEWVMPLATRRSNAHTHVYASERTYAYNKRLHRHRVTLETSTNKHTCQTGWNIETLSHTHSLTHKEKTDRHTHTHTLTLLKKVLWQAQYDSNIHKWKQWQNKLLHCRRKRWRYGWLNKSITLALSVFDWH